MEWYYINAKNQFLLVAILSESFYFMSNDYNEPDSRLITCTSSLINNQWKKEDCLLKYLGLLLLVNSCCNLRTVELLFLILKSCSVLNYYWKWIFAVRFLLVALEKMLKYRSLKSWQIKYDTKTLTLLRKYKYRCRDNFILKHSFGWIVSVLIDVLR